MARIVTVAAAQMGPIARQDTRAQVVERLIAQLHAAKAQGCDLIVFPELTLTTFFPRWFMEDQAEIDAFFETEMPGPDTAPLFAEAARLGLGMALGYAELAREDGAVRRYNTAILVDREGRIVGRYRKIHLPGHSDHQPWRPFQHLEKRYFDRGGLGFPVWPAFGGVLGMCICNDRRWPETWRVLGLQGVELVLVGYNTPRHYPPVPAHDHLQDFHNHLSLQAGAYQNGTWVVGVAKAGIEEGCELIGGSCIVAPTGEIVARCETLGDELAVFACDLDRCTEIKEHVFNFKQHRQPDAYRIITEPT